MNTTAIIGGQWGDEGKGKISHLLGKESDVIVRYNGGPNAGHTVVDKEGEIKFHHLPSGSLYQDCLVVLGNGMVINPLGLKQELENLEQLRSIEPKLFVSGRAHLILPYHPVVEKLEKSKNKVGTTGRGIGPTYQDKASRNGLRFWDLLQPDFPQRFRERLKKLRTTWPHSEELKDIDPDSFLEELITFTREKLSDRIINCSSFLNNVIDEGEKLIFEGAQGTMLDIDFGTYPFVTSSNPSIGGVATGTGVAPSKVNKRIGIVKAYTTRVGKGPLVTELTGSMGEKLRDAGGEYGATTGRPRRCGWLDLVALKYAQRINDFTGLVLTKADVLSGFSELKVATAYSLNGKKTSEFPDSLDELEQCRPVYESLEGWKADLGRFKNLSQFPSPVRKYIELLENTLEVPVKIVSVGKRSTETVFVD